MTEFKCPHCKDTGIAPLLTGVVPCTDCPPKERVAPPVVAFKNYTITITTNGQTTAFTRIIK